MRYSRLVSAVIIFSFAVSLVSCGGSSKPTSISIVPLSATLNPGATQQFTANVSGGKSTSVSWNVNGTTSGSSSVGTVSPTGLYTAPSKISGTFTANVQAVSTKDSSKTATATVKVVPKANASTNRTEQPLPVEMGTSGGNAHDESSKFCCSGTLGAIVNRGGSNFILSANHAIGISGAAKPGDPIIQPGLVDVSCTASKAQVVGNFSQAAPLKTSNVDAALAAVVPGTVDATGGILSLGGSGGVGAPAGDSISPGIGMPVAKSGRSTGLTCSTISSVKTSVKVDYQQGCNTGTTFTVTFSNQMVINGGTFSSSGDSGSLIVNSQTAEPVGLLYAGSSTDTVANPINDVLNALRDSSGATPVVVGGAQHSVACTGAATSTATPVSQDEVARVTAVKERNQVALNKIPGVTGFGVAASGDEPGKAAISIYVSPRTPNAAIPKEIEGVRTRVQRTENFSARQTTNAAEVKLSEESIQRAALVKQRHETELLNNPSILGLGIARSEDDPAEPAMIIFIDQNQLPPATPHVIDGIRTRVVPSERFRAQGWNEVASRSCSGQHRAGSLDPDHSLTLK